jgi:O-antigen/teichoic acid export membrane protein
MAYVVSIYTVLFYSIWRWRSFSRKWGVESIEKEGRRDIQRSARPLLALVICQQLTQWACLLVVGLFVVSDDVGRFAVAQRTSMLISFSLLAVNSVVGPMFAKLHDADNKEELQKIVTQSTRIVLLVATPLTLDFTVRNSSQLARCS